jgi:putative ABC transport system permease protein
MKLSDRFYRLLIKLCPAEFRDEYGDEMARLFRDRRRREGSARVLFEALPDLIITAWRQHMDMVWRDIRYSFRSMRKSPSFTTVAVLTLALGIGANTAIFSVVNAVLLRSLPYKESERLVRIWETAPKGRPGRDRVTVSPVNFLTWSRDRELFDDVAATTSGLNSTLILTGSDSPVKLMCDSVSSGFFRILGVQPILGRTFLPDEEQLGHDHVVLLSHDLWRTQFGADPQIVGRPITLDDHSYEVIGVMPAGFRPPDRLSSPEGAFLLKPLTYDAARATNRGEHFLNVIARLKAADALARTQARLDDLARQLEREYPQTNQGWGVRLVPLQRDLVGNVRQALLVLLGAVGCILLIACGNVANLFLSRVTAQAREMAIRTALGAGRLRLIRQLLTQSMLLASLGGALGVLLAFWGTNVLLKLAPRNIPRLYEAGIDLPVLAFVILTSLVTGLIFGLAPALQISRPDLNESLKDASRTSTGAAYGSRLRSVLVVAEVAIAMVLVIGAGLLIQSFRRIQSIEPGFRAEKVLAMDIAPPPLKYREPFARVAFFQQVMERVEVLPGVHSAAVVSDFPLGGSGGGGFRIEGRTPPANPREWDAEFRSISPRYFETMGIPVLDGRPFTALDGAKAIPVAIINKTMARRFWRDENPLGKRIRRRTPSDPPWLTIVGIAGDVRHQGQTREPCAEVYVPYQQPSWATSTTRFPFPRELVVRTDSDPANLVPALQRQVWAVDRNQPVSRVRTLQELLWNSVSQQRFNMLLLSLFGTLGLLLASVGIYGVLSYTVTRRIHEIGIRMALGAQPGRILAMVVGHGMGLAILGVGIGLVAALALTRVMSTLLFEITPTDPATFILVSALLLGVAFAACYIPARKATKVDPVMALRQG